jgi:hypothetical protein
LTYKLINNLKFKIMKYWDWKKILKIIGVFVALLTLSYGFYELCNYGNSIENYWLCGISIIFFSIFVILSFVIPYEILIYGKVREKE